MIGQTVGNYNVTAFLGKGGMGQVFLAEHPRIGRQVAIKLLHPELSTDRRLVERLFDEALATNLVKHPGIVQVFDCGFHRDRAYLVMEFLEGENLASVLRREQALPAAVACILAGQLASALGAAHEHQIVHRDLKPDNIFVMNGRQNEVSVKIVDFGIAKLTFRPAGSDTDSAVLLGTPAYMSPEQCAGARLVDPRTDIYALGCILFEMVVGRRPFVYQGWGEYIAAHQNEAPPNPTALRPTLPPELTSLILQMLAKRPEDRPPAMPEVEQRLRAVREQLSASGAATPALLIVKASPRHAGEPSTASPEPTVVSRRQRAEASRPRRRWRWAAVLAAAGVAVATGALLRRTSSHAVPEATAHEQPSPPAIPLRDANLAPAPAVTPPRAPPVPPAPLDTPHLPPPTPAPTPAPPPERAPERARPPRRAAATRAAKPQPSDHFHGFDDI